MRSKKFIKIFVTAVSAVALVSAVGCGYKPDSNSYYYDNGDTFRVIELDESKTQYIENYGIESYHIPLEGVANLSAKSEGLIEANTIYYDVIDNLSREALLQIYKALDIEAYPKLIDTVKYCASSGLCTRNEIKVYGTITSETFTKPYEGGNVIGVTANVNRYTFNYTDYAKSNGEAVSGGSFCILLVESVLISQFNYDDFTDLYSVKGAANE